MKKDYDGDVVVITGPMFREQTLYYTNLFLNPELVDDSGGHDAWPDGIKFDCCGCLATRSLGSAGWEGDHIRLVFSVDLPPDLLLLCQEMGRAGRRASQCKSDDRFLLSMLHSFGLCLPPSVNLVQGRQIAGLCRIRQAFVTSGISNYVGIQSTRSARLLRFAKGMPSRHTRPEIKQSLFGRA
jgi:hypothetical protein